MQRLRLLAPLLGLVTIAALATSCARSTDTVAPASGVAQDLSAARPETSPDSFWRRTRPGISGVMFVHASPDAPAVDIRLGMLPAARGLAFGENTPYRFTRSGERTIRVNVAATTTTVIEAKPTLERNTFYTVFAADRVANIGPVVLVDDLTPPARGKAHVRFVHLSPDAPAVDVAVAGGGPVVFGNTSFKGSTPFTPLAAGTYDLEVRLAGTNTVVLPLPGVKLEPRHIYTVYARGLVGGSGAQALGAGVIVNSPGFGYGDFGRALAAASDDAATAPQD